MQKRESIQKKYSPFEHQKTVAKSESVKRKIEETTEAQPIELAKRIKIDPTLLSEFVQFYEQTYDRVVVFDVETTGFTKSDQIIEIAAVEMVRGSITGNMFHCFIQLNDGVIIDERAEQVHGINKKTLQKCCHTSVEESLSSSTSAVLKRFLKFVGNDALVAHNLTFDLRMLKQDLDTCSDVYTFLDDNGCTLPSKENSFCTMSFFRRVFGKNCRYDLDSVCHYFGIDTSLRDRFGHNALGDCILTAKVYASYPDLCLLKSDGNQKVFKDQTPPAAIKNVKKQYQQDTWFSQAIDYLRRLF